MSIKSAPSQEAFDEWRNGIVGEWFFGPFIDALQLSLSEQWARAINDKPDDLLQAQTRIGVQSQNFDLMQGVTYDDVLASLGMEPRNDV